MKEILSGTSDQAFMYLNLLKAGKSGHIVTTVHIAMESNVFINFLGNKATVGGEKQEQKLDLSPFLEVLNRVYGIGSHSTTEWDAERKKILEACLLQFLLPKFEQEIKSKLYKFSVKNGVRKAAEALKKMAMTGPFRPTHLLEHSLDIEPTGELPVVGVILPSSKFESMSFVALNTSGEVVNHLVIPAGETRLDKFEKEIKTFLKSSRPTLIAVGTSAGMDAKRTLGKIQKIATVALDEWNRRHDQNDDDMDDDDNYENRLNNYMDDDDDSEWHASNVSFALVDDNVAQLFARSPRGKKEFPDYSTHLRAAAGLGRYAKDPLAEITNIWGVISQTGNFGIEMLFLNIHPLQKVLPRHTLLKAFERVLIDAVAAVGVDLNAAVEFSHLQGTLQFIPGLGPRKALAFRNQLKKVGGKVYSRHELLTKKLLDNFVYTNAAAYIRIRDKNHTMENLNPLDDTRIHPTYYVTLDWANQICKEATIADEKEDGGELSNNEENQDKR